MKAEKSLQNTKLITLKKMVKISLHKRRKIKKTTLPKKWIISTLLVAKTCITSK